MALTSDQVKIIRSTVPVLQTYGTQISTTFYSNLLDAVPDLQNIFNSSNQRSEQQQRALAGALVAYASNIDDLGVLGPTVERICQKHVSLCIQPAHYDAVGTYLLAAMAQVLGDALTPGIHDAWAAAYTQLADIMIGKEAQLYGEFNKWTSWRKFKIVKKVKESDVVTSFYLAPEDKKPLPSYQPGQYISLQIYIPTLGCLQSRQYSLSDAPRADYYRVSIKKEEGKSEAGLGLISNIFHNDKEVGDIIEVTHPAGDFFLDPSKDGNSPVVLISAGVGITPMISILNSLVGQNSTRRITFIHCARNSVQQSFSSHIYDIGQSHENIKVIVFKSCIVDEDVETVDYTYNSRIDLERINSQADLYSSDRAATYYICGPSSFMIETASQIRSLGVAEQKIKMELFGTGDAQS